mmetsp:Transcript_47648/g.34911  ORF Transcript_47648/g.34911 Transcript_47648/m.34911 type:complete len:87 (+) Transcript_47648:407-667(+)|eukprot:CAMPEP_0202980274 /NCGR_PEP_ID=MMETSP1396-20130829/86228_1 /ASSEMBLY_ACC=CAM_ASM_000872 /TAXON_ID= /ORGANISM="Pseudokeronopsis sp., Strain Brazil" /LENGTH=86 /DNA_ID=CAMNT_0049720143 /DNA_START=389 /DNA_END=649 /DNA_ORIENTATION=-
MQEKSMSIKAKSMLDPNLEFVKGELFISNDDVDDLEKLGVRIKQIKELLIEEAGIMKATIIKLRACNEEILFNQSKLNCTLSKDIP